MNLSKNTTEMEDGKINVKMKLYKSIPAFLKPFSGKGVIILAYI